MGDLKTELRKLSDLDTGKRLALNFILQFLLLSICIENVDMWAV